MMHLTSVLLPAPFSPSRAWKLPAGTFSDTWSSAVNSPKRLVIAIASTESARSGTSGSRLSEIFLVIAIVTAAPR